MLPISTKETVRFTPEHYAREAETEAAALAPVYLLSVPSLLRRSAWRRAVTEAGARYPGNDDVYAALRKDIRALGPGNAEELVAFVDDIAAKLAEDADKLGQAEAERFAAITDAVLPMGGDFAKVIAAREHWSDVAFTLAAQHFLAGWENVEAPFERRGGLVPEALLEQLPARDIAAIGGRVIALMTLGKVQEKNSASPSP